MLHHPCAGSRQKGTYNSSRKKKEKKKKKKKKKRKRKKKEKMSYFLPKNSKLNEKLGLVGTFEFFWRN